MLCKNPQERYLVFIPKGQILLYYKIVKSGKEMYLFHQCCNNQWRCFTMTMWHHSITASHHVISHQFIFISDWSRTCILWQRNYHCVICIWNTETDLPAYILDSKSLQYCEVWEWTQEIPARGCGLINSCGNDPMVEDTLALPYMHGLESCMFILYFWHLGWRWNLESGRKFRIRRYWGRFPNSPLTSLNEKALTHKKLRFTGC